MSVGLPGPDNSRFSFLHRYVVKSNTAETQSPRLARSLSDRLNGDTGGDEDSQDGELSPREQRDILSWLSRRLHPARPNYSEFVSKSLLPCFDDRHPKFFDAKLKSLIKEAISNCPNQLIDRLEQVLEKCFRGDSSEEEEIPEEAIVTLLKFASANAQGEEKLREFFLATAPHSEHSFLLDCLKGYALGTNASLLTQALFELAESIAPDELRAEASTIIKGLEQRTADWDPLPVSNSGFDLLAELKKISPDHDV